MRNRPVELKIRTASAGAGGPTIQLTGEVDLRTSPALRSRLLAVLETEPARVVIDLSKVGHMDSSGVGTLVEAKRLLERQGGRLVLAGLQPRVRSVFEITQLDTFFLIVDTVDEARSR
jgi:anti-sigma B factor antagonist